MMVGIPQVRTTDMVKGGSRTVKFICHAGP